MLPAFFSITHVLRQYCKNKLELKLNFERNFAS